MKTLTVGIKVAYAGEEVIFGYKNQIELDKRQLKPISETYIWHVIKQQNKPNLYIIQHEQGVAIDFFKQQKKAFGEQDFKILEQYPDLNFTYTSEHTLTVLDDAEQPTTGNEQQKEQIDKYIETEQPTDLDPIIEELPDESKIIQLKEDEEVITNNEQQTTDIPHFTPQNFILDNNSLQKVILKNRLMFAKEMDQNFTAEINGEFCRGLKTDYLLISTNKELEIFTEEAFLNHFEIATEPKKIGKAENEYYLNTEVQEYINFLEEENVRLRAELYLSKAID